MVTLVGLLHRFKITANLSGGDPAAKRRNKNLLQKQPSLPLSLPLPFPLSISSSSSSSFYLSFSLFRSLFLILSLSLITPLKKNRVENVTQSTCSTPFTTSIASTQVLDVLQISQVHRRKKSSNWLSAVAN